MSRSDSRSVLGFLTLVGLALLGSACGGGQLPSPDGGTNPNPCATAGCAAPPLCSVGCTATCGCCSCSPGEHTGDLVCTDQGCYAPAPAADAGSDAGWAPPAACQLPFDVGPCRAAIGVYAFVEGACVQRTYGGCQGNDNRFFTLEECMATCLGQPVPGACPPNRVDREICLACGPAGGCGKTAKVCALVCDANGGAGVCPPELPSCHDGVCQMGFCI
jgi:hypothetical protein